MPDLTELQRLAEEAGAGLGEEWLPEAYLRSMLTHEEDAAFVAAMSPDTAKKLIAVALAAQKAVDALEEAQTYTASRSWSPSMTRECKDAEVGLRTALEELK